jgi:hypothetical protein
MGKVRANALISGVRIKSVAGSRPGAQRRCTNASRTLRQSAATDVVPGGQSERVDEIDATLGELSQFNETHASPSMAAHSTPLLCRGDGLLYERLWLLG